MPLAGKLDAIQKARFIDLLARAHDAEQALDHGGADARRLILAFEHDLRALHVRREPKLPRDRVDIFVKDAEHLLELVQRPRIHRDQIFLLIRDR